MQQAERDDHPPGLLDEEPDTETAAAGRHVLEGLLDELERAGSESVSIADIVAAFEHRSVGALIAILGLMNLLPVVGAIPGVPMVTATLILLVIGQSLLTRHGGIWVPGFIGRRRIAADRLRRAAEASRPWLRRIDGWIRPRLGLLTHGRAARLAIVVVIVVMTLTLYPLDLVPWGATAPTVGILSLSLALMSGDGYLALIGYTMVAATVLTGLLIF